MPFVTSQWGYVSRTPSCSHHFPRSEARDAGNLIQSINEYFPPPLIWTFSGNSKLVLVPRGVCALRHAAVRRPVQGKPHHREEAAAAVRKRHAGYGGEVQRSHHASEGEAPTINH